MSYSSSQRTAIQQFIAFTQCSDRTAVKFLKSASWNVEAAADSYFHSASSLGVVGSAASSRGELNKLFDQFREAGDAADTFGVNGSMRFLQAIDVGLEEPTVMLVAELLKAPTMGEFTREGFVAGWLSLGCKNLEQMRARVPALRRSLSSEEEVFKRVYMYTFALARSPGQKSLLLETAIEYWKLLLNKRFEAQLPVWIEFLEKEYGKAISKDTWNCMYDFVLLVQRDPTLKTYDVDGAWPSILDDFVRYLRQQNPQAESVDEEMAE